MNGEPAFAARYGPWALAAGASMGIGRALSHEAARRGLDVVMLARSADTLEDAAAEVRARHGVEVRTVAADLGAPDVGLFVYNATMAPQGRFLDVALADHLRSIVVNCATPAATPASCAASGRLRAGGLSGGRRRRGSRGTRRAPGARCRGARR